MKKQLVFIVALFLVLLPLNAQKTKDALYLKNGSIIYGKLLEISDSKYKIQTADGSLFIFSNEEVDKFMQESPVYTGRKIKGAGFALESGVLIGSQSSEYEAPFSFNIIANYTSSKNNIFGLGSGVEFIGATFCPVFIEYKRLINVRKTTPFIFFRGGGMFPFGEDTDNETYTYDYERHYKGGCSFTAGTGISWARDDSESYLSFGYRYAQTSYKQRNYNNVNYTYKNNYNRLEVKFGFKF